MPFEIAAYVFAGFTAGWLASWFGRRRDAKRKAGSPEPPPARHKSSSYTFPSHWSAEDCAKVIDATGKAEAAQLEAFRRTLHGPEKKTPQ